MIGHTLRIMGIIIRAQLRSEQTILFNRALNNLIWISTWIFIQTYILPTMGMSAKYGPFMLASTIAAVGILDVHGAVALLIADLEGRRSLNLYLTAPISPAAAWLALIIALTLRYAFATLCLMPFAYLLIMAKMCVFVPHWGKFICIWLTSSLLYASLVFVVAAHTHSMQFMANVWSRILHPLWFLGCFQYPYHLFAGLFPWLGIWMLANPMIYIMEGYRSALLQDNSLSAWLCTPVLLTMSCIFIMLTIRKFYRRLDMA